VTTPMRQTVALEITSLGTRMSQDRQSSSLSRPNSSSKGAGCVKLDFANLNR